MQGWGSGSVFGARVFFVGSESGSTIKVESVSESGFQNMVGSEFGPGF